MTLDNSLYSIQIERQVISGLLNHPNSCIELSSILHENLFYQREYRIIFSLLKESILSGKKVEKTIIAQKLVDLKVRMDIEPFDLLDSLSFSQIQPAGIIECVKELVKLSIKRDLWQNAAAVQKYLTKESNNDPVDKMISTVDTLYNNQINQYKSDDEPTDLYAGIEAFLKEIAANPKDECGLLTPFKQWNKWFGGLIAGEGCYNVISRSGEGKSTLLFNMAKEVGRLNNIPTLYLDTEMTKNLNMFRAAAAAGQVNSWYLRTGNWVKNAALASKVTNSFKELDKYKGHLYHMYVPNKDVHQIMNIMKRWYFKHVGRGNQCLFVYDYMKITSDVDKDRQEWQQLGDKISYLNEIGHDLNSPIFTAGQQNRGAQKDGSRNDDSTTAGASDRINQYCCFNAVFRAKTLDEIEEHGTDFGSHLLKPFKFSRTQGKDDFNKEKTVKVTEKGDRKPKYKDNFINYQISEYELIEKGTYQHIVNNNQLSAPLQIIKKGQDDTDDKTNF